ncbi:MAG TPA: hypothetical protein VGQ35_20240 [Dongiaceae bacterium]|jgi:hypothetical protein|nr:hypothetical protein [Dongiaceae bacterium]
MSSKPFQTSRDFADALDRFGADLQSWPEELRHEGNAMLERSDDARKLLREARIVHRVLSERLSVATDSHLVNAILERKSELDKAARKPLSAEDAMKGVAAARGTLLKRGIAAAVLVGSGVLAGSLLSQAGGGTAGHSTTLTDIASYAESFYL